MEASTALDVIVAQVESDDVSTAAEELINHLRGRWEPVLIEAESAKVELASNPVAQGLSQFNEKLAAIRLKANFTSTSLAALIDEKRKADDRRKAAKAAYEEKLNLTLTQDPDITEAKEAAGIKLSMAKELCKREARIVQYTERIFQQVNGYYNALKMMHDNIAETKKDLMAQLAVIKQQIAIGEVNSSSFPIPGGPSPRSGVSAPTSMQELEMELAADLPAQSGNVAF